MRTPLARSGALVLAVGVTHLCPGEEEVLFFSLFLSLSLSLLFLSPGLWCRV